MFSLKEQIKAEHSLSPTRRKINWKNTSFPLVNIDKTELNKILKRYHMVPDIEAPFLGFYKFYVGEGNNSQLIKKCLKSRGYWMQVDFLADSPNLVWTQLPWEEFQRK